MSFTAKINQLFGEFGDHVLQQKFANIQKFSTGDDVIVSLSDGAEAKMMVVGNPHTYNSITYITLADRNLRGTTFEQLNSPTSKGKTFHHGGKYLNDYAIDDIRTDPEWLKTRISYNRNFDLPCFMNAELFKSIVQEIVLAQVIPNKDNLYVVIKTMLADIVANVLDTHFIKRFPALHRYLLDNINDKMEAYFNETNKLLIELFEMNETPYKLKIIIYSKILTKNVTKIFKI